MEYGKTIDRIDDSSKEFQQKCLSLGETNEEKQGKGIDIETVYYAKECDLDGNVNDEIYKYYIFEYLKDETDYYDPWQCSPNKYPKNWRKFYTLYRLAQMLKGQLVLVSYSNGKLADGTDGPAGFKDKVKVMFVKELKLDILDKLKNMSQGEIKNYRVPYIVFSDVRKMHFEEYAKWLIKMNQNCKLPPLLDDQGEILFP